MKKHSQSSSRMSRKDHETQQAILAASEEMIQTLTGYGIKNSLVLGVMEKIPRHLFIPNDELNIAESYGDYPLKIGFNQTISQPYIVAYMIDLLGMRKKHKILEIGTGSGYNAAPMAALGAQVFSIEIIPQLAESATKILRNNGFHQVLIKRGDGNLGWEKHAPFQRIILTCAPYSISPTLLSQLDEGGRMIFPEGGKDQKLVIIDKKEGKLYRRNDIPVRFVPMKKEV